MSNPESGEGKKEKKKSFSFGNLNADTFLSYFPFLFGGISAIVLLVYLVSVTMGFQ